MGRKYLVGIKVLLTLISGLGYLLQYSNVIAETSETPLDKSIKKEKGLIGAWKFDEGSGEIVHDYSGHGSHGIIHGATWVKGKFGYALRFDGKDDWVEIKPEGETEPTEGMTIEAWVKLDDFGRTRSQVIASNPDWVLSYGWWRDINFGKLGESKALKLICPSPTKWHHIAVVVDLDGCLVELYIDGRLMEDHRYKRGMPAIKLPVYIGRHGRGAFFHGTIDELKVYNRALTAWEIKAHYEGRPINYNEFSESDLPKLGRDMKNLDISLDLVLCRTLPREIDEPYEQSLNYYVKNLSEKPIEITDIFINKQNTKAPNVSFNSISGRFRLTVTIPPIILPDNYGLVNIKYLGLGPFPSSHEVVIISKSGRVFQKQVQMLNDPPVRIHCVAFSDDLKTMYVYVKGLKQCNLSKISIDGLDITQKANITERHLAPEKIVPIVVSLPKTLEEGSFKLLVVESDKGKDAALVKVLRSFFPVGIYGLSKCSIKRGWEPKGWSNWLQGYREYFAGPGESAVPPKEWLQDARRHFINVAAPDYREMGGDPDLLVEMGLKLITYGRKIPSVSTHPALLAWCAADEPLRPPLGRVNAIRRADPVHPVMIVLNSPVWPRCYESDFVDIGCYDYYPVPQAPLERITADLEVYREAIAPKPVWFIPQAFRKGPGLTKGTWSRFPHPEEERLMVYMAIAEGVKGIIYFTYNIKPEPIEGVGLSKAPEAKMLWEEIGKISLELQLLGGLLSIGDHAETKIDGKIQISSIYTGDDTVVFVILNHNFEYSQKGFSVIPCKNVTLRLRLPSWLSCKDVFELRWDGLKPLSYRAEKRVVRVMLKEIQSATVVIVTQDKNLREVLTKEHQKLITRQ